MNKKQQLQGGGRGQRGSAPEINNDLINRINFRKVDPELFNKVAKESAVVVAYDERLNKPTQLRKFYDEICMWDAKVDLDEARFRECIPLIKMINAKVAYARGRKLVDENYLKLLSHCVNQIESAKEFRNCKLFMESFMGFYKSVRPR